MAKHFKQRALLVEALGPGAPQLTIDEFDSVDAAREELRVRYERYSKGCFEGSSLDYDHAIIYSDNWPGEWQVYKL